MDMYGLARNHSLSVVGLDQLLLLVISVQERDSTSPGRIPMPSNKIQPVQAYPDIGVED